MVFKPSSNRNEEVSFLHLFIMHVPWIYKGLYTVIIYVYVTSCLCCLSFFFTVNNLKVCLH